MKCLALDTTTDVCSIAVADESGILGEHNFAHAMNLSRRLMPNIAALVGDCGLEIKGLEAVGVSLGPGSLTGLRIGVVTAKTLAQVLRVPIVGVVSLDLLAHQFAFIPGSSVCSIVKLRKGEVYYAFYRTAGGEMERLSEYGAGPIERLLEDVPDPMRDPIIFVGDALSDNLPGLKDSLGDRVVPAPSWLCYPKASILAGLALKRIAAGESSDPISLVPFYVRRSMPELRMEGRTDDA